MSAALQSSALAHSAAERCLHPARSAASHLYIAASASLVKSQRTGAGPQDDPNPESHRLPAPVNTLAFYRKQTQKILRRYLCSSMLVGRMPTIFKEPFQHGWASHCPVETFEDSVIFVLDMEKCLDRLSALDRVLISRIVLQEYSMGETALLLNRSERLISRRFGEAIDHLTEILLETGILRLPRQHHGAPNRNPDD